MQRDKVACKLQDAWRSLGIEKAAVHAFRHTAASELRNTARHHPWCSVKCVTAIHESRCRSIRT